MKHLKLRKVCITLLTASIFFTGCGKDDDNSRKSIAQEFIGKWEMLSMTYNGIEYNLPHPGMPIGASTAGHEFTANTYKYILNGNTLEEYSGVYIENGKFYMASGMDTGLAFEVSQDTLIGARTVGPNVSWKSIKVTKFSWE